MEDRDLIELAEAAAAVQNDKRRGPMARAVLAIMREHERSSDPPSSVHTELGAKRWLVQQQARFDKLEERIEQIIETHQAATDANPDANPRPSAPVRQRPKQG